MCSVTSSFSKKTLQGNSFKKRVVSLMKATNYLISEKQFVSSGQCWATKNTGADLKVFLRPKPPNLRGRVAESRHAHLPTLKFWTASILDCTKLAKMVID